MEGFLNPEKVLNQLGLEKDMTAADFGSGSGGWVIPLAKILEEGKVFAIDVLEEPLSSLQAKMRLEKISNVEIILADVETGVDIFDGTCGLVLMTNLLFQIEDKKRALEEGKRILKPGGKILVVDWKKDVSLGPKEGRVQPEEVKEMAKDLQLKIEKEFEASPYHWALILVK
ncbi:MAG: methyltransferase domain-containing protein [bacterium]|nr:methyltransferase domain-containing protein [bacterium]